MYQTALALIHLMTPTLRLAEDNHECVKCLTSVQNKIDEISLFSVLEKVEGLTSYALRSDSKKRFRSFHPAFDFSKGSYPSILKFWNAK